MLGIGTEAAVFLYACMTGVTAVYAYHVLTYIRKIIRHSNLAVGVEDFVYWLLLSGYLFRQMYEAVYGNIRWFFVLGTICGALTGYALEMAAKKIYVKFKKKLEKFRKTR